MLLLLFSIGMLGWGIVLALRYHRLKRGGRRATAAIKSIDPRYRSTAITITWKDDQGQQREQEITIASSYHVGEGVDIYYDDVRAMLTESKMFYGIIAFSTFFVALALMLLVF
ncbi:MAG: hypothetical protein FWD06_03150 [Oscillospiraceae bacterium]|nr:hypothetical protein [Oscillospiraceae bacterium]